VIFCFFDIHLKKKTFFSCTVMVVTSDADFAKQSGDAYARALGTARGTSARFHRAARIASRAALVSADATRREFPLPGFGRTSPGYTSGSRVPTERELVEMTLLHLAVDTADVVVFEDPREYRVVAQALAAETVAVTADRFGSCLTGRCRIPPAELRSPPVAFKGSDKINDGSDPNAVQAEQRISWIRGTARFLSMKWTELPVHDE
jgi:hypothetical protein